MLVYGFDTDKNLVSVDLSINEMVMWGIDPWRVDLFEPSPITISRAPGLGFTRLCQVALAYPCMAHRGKRHNVTIPHTICVAIRDANGETVTFPQFTGRYDGSGCFVFEMDAFTKVSTDKEAFRQVLREYLKRSWQQGLVYTLDGGAKNVGIADGRMSFQIAEGRFTSEFAVCPLKRTQFTGKMFAEVHWHQALSPEVNWVFEAFPDLAPIVHGGALRDHLRQVTSRNVDVAAHSYGVDGVGLAGAKKFKQRLTALGATDLQDLSEGAPEWCHLSFRYRDTTYSLRTLPHPFHTLAGIWNCDFSVNQIYAVRPGEIVASRIALHDLNRCEARLVSNSTPVEDFYLEEILRRQWRERAQQLRAKGFRIHPNLFAVDEFDAL